MSGKFPPGMSGTRRYYYELTRRVEHGRIRVLACATPGAAAFDATSGVDTRRVRFWQEFRLEPSADCALLHVQVAALLLHETVTRRARLVLCGDAAVSPAAAALVRAITHRPYVVFCHGEDLPVRYPDSPSGRYTMRFIRAADRVVVNSRFTAGLAARLGVAEERLSVVRPGVDPSPPGGDRSAARDRLGLGDGPVLLSVGRLEPRKGQLRVLRSLVHLRQRYPDLVYVVAGDGPDRAVLGAEVDRLGLAPHVRLLGAVDEATLHLAYVACDLFVLPTAEEPPGDFEGFGMVFLEANRYGKAVVAGRCGGVPEAVEDGVSGVLVDGQDIAALTRAIAALLDDPVRRRLLGRRGQERARAAFSWDRSFAELQTALWAAVRGRPAGPCGA